MVRRSNPRTANTFEDRFLETYLTHGLGSMTKSDIDALVMHLLDEHGYRGSDPLSSSSNQAVSELLRTPVAKVKKLRYEAALKFGEDVEQLARRRLLAALGSASLDVEKGRIIIVLEDSLAKNWLQGKLKDSRQVYDHSFNAEIIKIDPGGFFLMLDSAFGAKNVRPLRQAYEELEKERKASARRRIFGEMMRNFVGAVAGQVLTGGALTVG